MNADNDHESIAKRIRLFRKSVHGCSTQKEFATALGIDQQRLSEYENRTRVPHHVVAAMIRMGANLYWLLFGEGTMRGTPDTGEMSATATSRPSTLRGVCFRLATRRVLYSPPHADEIAAGQSRESRSTEIEGPAILHRAWCPHPQETECLRVVSTGNSMEPMIPAGAVVTIDRAECDPERLIGKVMAVGLREGGVTLKRLQRNSRGGYVGVPDNQGADHTVVAIDDGDRLLGVVQTVNARIG